MDSDQNQSNRSVADDLNLIKRELNSTGNWPDSANRLWYHLIQNDSDGGNQGDEIMISLVISDALEGVDIAEKYPEFYQRMLQNPKLFHTFLDAIEVLDADIDGSLDSAPIMDAPIPQKRPKDAGPVVESLSPGAWIARWWQGVEQLTAIFQNFFSMPQPGYRSGWAMLEESSTPLIRSEVTVENTNLGVQLKVSWADDPDSMNLQLMVALLDEKEDSADFEVSSLMAGIRWGDYYQRCPVNEYGKAIFPLLPINAITDETGQEINTDLQLILHPID